MSCMCPSCLEERKREAEAEPSLDQQIDTAAARFRIMRYFKFAHLPPALQSVSQRFAELALHVESLSGNDPAETTVALRKLLEAKDAAVRSVLK